ncbi:MAG: Abi family protein [Alphaproteobacteria bacterium]|nr:Abi family protein [Alphaproteobacteria bacterium]
MTVPYKKPHLTFEEQIALLKHRGMQVSDEGKATEFLQKIGYYRLSGYWYPFRKSRLVSDNNGKPSVEVLDDFREGAEFHQSVDLYVFDKKLRILLLDALERIEIALRVDVAYNLGKLDPYAYRNSELLHGNFTKKTNPRTGKTEHTEWLERFDQLANRSHEDFIDHYNQTYDLPLPIWIAVELWDFGELSRFISGMRYSDLSQIALRYGIPRPDLLASWVRNMNLVRNICAHHGRIWNRSLADSAKMPKKGEIELLNHLAEDGYARYRLYGSVAIMGFLLRTINPTTTWGDRLMNLYTTFPKAPGINIGQTGFPENWDLQPLWL